MEVTVRKYDKKDVVIPFVEELTIDATRILRITTSIYFKNEKFQALPSEDWQRVTIDK